MTIIRPLTGRNEIVPGALYMLENYTGVCGGCGAYINLPDFMVSFTGNYQGSYGVVHCFATLFYVLCPTCKSDIGNIDIFFQGLDVSLKESEK